MKHTDLLLLHAIDLTGLVSVSVSVSISVSHSLVSVLALVSLCSGLINKPVSSLVQTRVKMSQIVSDICYASSTYLKN